MWKLSTLLLLLLCVTVAGAQSSDCPDLVQSALEYTDQVCSTTQRNQACYGNLQVLATPVDSAAGFKFDAPGDQVNITNIQSLELSALSTPDEWGVMLMQVQANLPDSVPGQNVTMLLFGDVTLNNRGSTVQAVLLDATASGNARVRSGPGTGNSQITSLKGGDAVQVDGRNEKGDWVRIILPDGNQGWVSASLLKVTGDISGLNVVEGTDIGGKTYGPMQAFYFSSGVGTAGCDAAPPDGLLIQTPEGAGEIDLLINEVQVNVGSTIFVTAQPNGVMRVSVLEGHITLTAAGVTVDIPAGATGSVPLDASGIANGAPALEGGYEDAAMAVFNAPLALLPATIAIAPALTVDPNASLSGIWVWAAQPSQTGCGGTLVHNGGSARFTIAPNGSTLTVSDVSDGSGTSVLNGTGAGVYSLEVSQNGSTTSWTLTVVNPTTIQSDITYNINGCVLVATPRIMIRQGE